MIRPSPAPKVRREKLWLLPYIYGYVGVAVAAWQLVFFEDFAQYVSKAVGGSAAYGAFWSMLLIGLEVFSLPFLLRLTISPLARACSAILAFLMPIAWFAVWVSSSSFHYGYLFLSIGLLLVNTYIFWLLGGQGAIRLRHKNNRE